MRKGWVAISREITEHWIFDDAEMFRAWVHLLTLAAWRDSRELYHGAVVFRKRGTVAASMRWLSDRWHWSEKRVARFLDLLEKDGMITTEKSRAGTTITICNYDKWQPKVGAQNGAQNDAQNDAPTTHRETAVIPTGPLVEKSVDNPKSDARNGAQNGAQMTDTIRIYKNNKEVLRKQEEKDPARRLQEMRAKRDAVNSKGAYTE